MHKIFEYINSDRSRERIEKIFIYLAFVLFFLHLLVIFLANQTELFPKLLANVNTNYLSALYTPFSVILVYEVYFMILSIPLSFTESIKKQYEIISLIIIRRVFKDISEFESFEVIFDELDELFQIIMDLGAGLILFALVGVFYHVSKYRESESVSENDNLKYFIKFKEIVTICLAILLFFVAIISFEEWLREVYLSAYASSTYSLDLENIFFDDFFSVMIFADTLIFIASFLYSNKYEILIRNAGYVASTILIRISFTLDDLYGPLIAIGAVFTGIAVQIIYRYFRWLETDNAANFFSDQ
jgi:hypothetical protein